MYFARGTFEPLLNAKRIQSIQQWVSAFNIFVSVYFEKFTAETRRLMKYCEVVRDLAKKAGDWIWYDEQLCYLQQPAPEKQLWVQIHWELWIRASVSFRKTQPLLNNRNRAALVFVHNCFQKERVGPFRPESTAWVVSSPMSVLSAEQSTPVVNVPHRLHQPDPISVLKANEEELKYSVLQHPAGNPGKHDTP